MELKGRVRMTNTKLFKEKINQFIELLGAEIDGFFNPWAGSNKSSETSL